jgi:hypothetical protein
MTPEGLGGPDEVALFTMMNSFHPLIATLRFDT